jgi:hypothetical protein
MNTPTPKISIFDIIDSDLKALGKIECNTIKNAVTEYIKNNKVLFKNRFMNIDQKSVSNVVNIFENNVDLAKKLIQDLGPLVGKINCVVDGINNSDLKLQRKLQYKDISDIEYSIVKAIIDNNNVVKEQVYHNSVSSLYMILAIVFFIIILILVFFMVFKNNKK